MALSASGVRAQESDMVVDFKGDSIPARVLRFEDNVFTISVSNEIRELPVDEVTSIFFDFNKPAAATAAAPSPAPRTTVTPPSATVATTAQTTAATTPIGPVSQTVVRQAPAKIPPPYGQPEASFLASELRAHGAEMTGKVVKLEFHYRSQLQALPDGAFMVALRSQGDYSGLWVTIDKDAYPWFQELPETPSYLDRNFQKPRGYYVYGVVIDGAPQYVAGMLQPVSGYTIQPIGRRTQRGLRGALDYSW